MFISWSSNFEKVINELQEILDSGKEDGKSIENVINILKEMKSEHDTQLEKYNQSLTDILDNDKFKRNNNDVHQRVKLSFKDLVLGCSTELDTLSGKIRIKVKEGTEVGHILRVPKKGFIRDNTVGDMMVEVWIDIPKELNEENKKVIESLNI